VKQFLKVLVYGGLTVALAGTLAFTVQAIACTGGLGLVVVALVGLMGIWVMLKGSSR